MRTCTQTYAHTIGNFHRRKIIIFCFPKEPCDILNPTSKPSSFSVDLLLQCFKDGTEWIIANTLTEKKTKVKGYKLPNTTM